MNAFRHFMADVHLCGIFENILLAHYEFVQTTVWTSHLHYIKLQSLYMLKYVHEEEAVTPKAGD